MSNTQRKSGSSLKGKGTSKSYNHNSSQANSSSFEQNSQHHSKNYTRFNPNNRRADAKTDHNPYSTATKKEDSHKDHPKANYIFKAVAEKIKSLEPLYRPRQAILVKMAKDILKHKKIVSNHIDTINKLHNPNFVPRSIRVNISITASKETMSQPGFLEVAERNKALQQSHQNEYKANIIEAQEMELTTLCEKLFTKFFQHSFDFCCANISKELSSELSSRLYNKSFDKQTAITAMEVIFDSFININREEVLQFFNTDLKEFQLLAETILLNEYAKLTDTTVVNYHLDIFSITRNLDLADNTFFIQTIQESSFAPINETNDNESQSAIDLTNESESTNEADKVTYQENNEQPSSVAVASPSLSQAIKSSLKPKSILKHNTVTMVKNPDQINLEDAISDEDSTTNYSASNSFRDSSEESPEIIPPNFTATNKRKDPPTQLESDNEQDDNSDKSSQIDNTLENPTTSKAPMIENRYKN